MNDNYKQKKPQINTPLRNMICSGVSQRRAAILLRVHRTTIVRHLAWLAMMARKSHKKWLNQNHQMDVIQFDDMESFEHTKCKPLSITVAVEEKSRKIIAAEVSRMPAKGHLAKTSRRKYGPRPDKRPIAWDAVLNMLKGITVDHVLIKSDQNPHYVSRVRRFLPNAYHERFKGRRGCIVGQGELKEGGFDPIFCLNHSCAMIRANVNRLFRRTWCTTKIPERLADHLAIYIQYHNTVLLP